MTLQKIEQLTAAMLDQHGSEYSDADKREIARQVVDCTKRRERFRQKMVSPEFRWHKPNSLRR